MTNKIQELKKEICAAYKSTVNLVPGDTDRAIIFAIDCLSARKLLPPWIATAMIKDLVSDDEIMVAFEGTNFGSVSPRQVIADTLLKLAGGYGTGSTALLCCLELGLIKRKDNYLTRPKLSTLGKKYLYWAFTEEL